MKRVFLAALFCACATKPPVRPLPRVANAVEVIHVQVGWYQLTPGQPNRPPVELVNAPAPDPRHAEEIARDVLAQCEKGAPMAPLQQKYSESDLGTTTVDDATHQPYKDLALSLKDGECALMRTDGAFHVIKRVR